MSDYDGNDIWNKYVLSSRLNESTDGGCGWGWAEFNAPPDTV